MEIVGKLPARDPMKGAEPPLEAFLAGLRLAWKEGEVRPTARARPTKPRGWRRQDPFKDVSGELLARLNADPGLSGRELLEKVAGWRTPASIRRTDGAPASTPRGQSTVRRRGEVGDRKPDQLRVGHQWADTASPARRREMGPIFGVGAPGGLGRCLAGIAAHGFDQAIEAPGTCQGVGQADPIRVARRARLSGRGGGGGIVLGRRPSVSPC